MIARVHRPAPPLNQFVDCMWLFERQSVVHTRERALPAGTVELVINLSEDPIRIFRDDTDFVGQRITNAVVCGVHSKYFVLDTSRPGLAIGVHFRPGGAAAFLGAPAQQFADAHIELEDVWGSGALRLRERLLAAATFGAPGGRGFEDMGHAWIVAQKKAPRLRRGIRRRN